MRTIIIAILSMSIVYSCEPSAEEYFDSGITKGKSSDYREAIEDFNKAIELDSMYAKAYHNRGLTKGKLSDYRGAIEDFNKAVEIDPKYGRAYHNRGLAKGMLGDKNGGCLDFAKADELGHDEAYAMIKKNCK